VRHEYLHYLLDPLVVKYRGLLPEPGPFLKKMKQMPSATKPYKDDFSLMVAESLVLATESRLRRLDRMTRTENLVENYEKGLILVPYFDEALEEFEKVSDSILEVFPAMIEGISWGLESKRDVAVERLKHEVASHSAEPAGQREAPPAQPPSEIRMLLEQANTLLLARRFDDAEPVLKQALLLDETNAGALFGLAQIAAHREDLARALELYGKAAANAKDQAWIAGWCLVQRGNILMHQGEYTRARAEWAQVSELQGDLRGAAEAAAKALAETRTPPVP
jgi:tetratricopeptide (TPR) repeat protein